MSMTDDLPMIHKVSRKAFGRLRAAGCEDYEYDDIFQQMAETYLICLKTWKPEQCRLSTYYYRSAYNNFNRTLDKEVRRANTHVSHMSVPGDEDEYVPVDETLDVVECSTRHDYAPSEFSDPSVLIDEEDHYQKTVERLSPIAQFMLANLIKPCDELVAALDEVVARTEYALARGANPGQRRRKVDLYMICKFLRATGLPESVVTAARKELYRANSN